MITPPYLSTGDKVAIVASARKVLPDEIRPAIDMLAQWGLNAVEGKNLYKQANQFAGSDEERLADLQWALNDAEIKAILFARGGYGTMRIASELVYSKFTRQPKWIIGFSDITTLHLHLNETGIETLHAPMAFNFSKAPTEVLASVQNILFGKKLNYSIPGHKFNRKGVSTGVLTGGNLSIVYAESAANPDMDLDNKILFIEDLDEYLYHIDRMVVSIKRSGRLANLAGLIVGSMNDMRDNTKAFGFAADNPFGKTAGEIIIEHVDEYDFPVCFNFPAGHIPNNCPLIFGREVELNVGNEVTLNF